jgi:hypothetical protein
VTLAARAVKAKAPRRPLPDDAIKIVILGVDKMPRMLWLTSRQGTLTKVILGSCPVIFRAASWVGAI